MLHRCQKAGFRFLDHVTSFEHGLITPRIEADLHKAIGAGSIHIEVTVDRVGWSSFTLRSKVRQQGDLAAAVRMVLVSYDYDRSVSVALTPE